MQTEARIERIVNGLLPDGGLRNQYAGEVSLAKRMKDYNTPGVSIAVIRDFKVEWARGYGVREAGKPDPVTETTLFQAGSISKPVFALAAMRLVQEGVVSLDEDVNDRLRTWHVPANGNWQPRVTLRQLLSHSAGLTVHGFPGYERTEQLPSLVQILNGQPPAHTPPVRVNLVPGVQFRYSGGGTTVAQLLVQELCEGKSFPDLMEQFILAPAGLANSTYAQPLPPHLHSAAAAAHPWKGRPVSGNWHVYPEMAAAGLWTTPSDLARLGTELQMVIKRCSNFPLTASTLTQMLVPPAWERMGLGFFVDGEGQSARFGHGGSNEGFTARLTLYRHLGLGAAIMINSNEGSPMISEIERAIAREYEWPDYFPALRDAVSLPHELLARYAGSYRTRSGLQLSIVEKEGELLAQVQGQAPVRLLAESDTSFRMEAANAEITFGPKSDGEPVSLTFRQEGKSFLAERYGQ
ncbi:serine hydrolase [Paenibacillus ginsengarvi]|uniref:serine hydrolase n=1 Tax=Paenibacillus ginsengarvi TaxID=400777 RepID=UPI001EFFC453|nr:serine hydrolase [Paenibacillus ginsengarvi]